MQLKDSQKWSHLKACATFAFVLETYFEKEIKIARISKIPTFACFNIESTSVVFPWSTWATIAIFRMSFLRINWPFFSEAELNNRKSESKVHIWTKVSWILLFYTLRNKFKRAYVRNSPRKEKWKIPLIRVTNDKFKIPHCHQHHRKSKCTFHLALKLKNAHLASSYTVANVTGYIQGRIHMASCGVIWPPQIFAFLFFKKWLFWSFYNLLQHNYKFTHTHPPNTPPKKKGEKAENRFKWIFQSN